MFCSGARLARAAEEKAVAASHEQERLAAECRVLVLQTERLREETQACKVGTFKHKGSVIYLSVTDRKSSAGTQTKRCESKPAGLA